MKANRQRLLTTISVVVNCWDRSTSPKDFTDQVGTHIEDLRLILHDELVAIHNKRVAHVPAGNRVRMESLYKRGQSAVQEFRKGERQ
jgi:hypothetical protein